ncbi:TRAP-type C4-dicarboxylate transport system, small permease component [Modicisalibacter muralis]|uniref:TRAP transporter small permease protein n=1 Tax=Modicisalibacter muralis TaxID=119000 RepID=A0A1G9GYC0_9GAMM|nr:TRAP transporter small permease [Halomonas muralis]SDL05574.1 TRAP-type C4-dicarboxylate transport system, small permease component [Halomonas muralis]
MKANDAYRAANGLAHGTALMAGYAALFLAGLITFEVIARKFFNFSIQGANEIGGYVLAIGVAFSFAYALLQRAHTRVDVLLAKLPAALRAPLNVIASVLLAGFAGFMLWRGADTLLVTLEFQSHASTPLQTPLWIPQSLWVAGLAVFALLATLLALRAIYLLLGGNVAQLNTEFDPRSADEELDEARHDYVDAATDVPQRSHHA